MIDYVFFFFKQKTAYEMRISDWISDVCSSDLLATKRFEIAELIQINSAISNRFVANGGNDVQTLSLRGLGAERTLVLINGRRAGPAGIRGAVERKRGGVGKGVYITGDHGGGLILHKQQ